MISFENSVVLYGTQIILKRVQEKGLDIKSLQQEDMSTYRHIVNTHGSNFLRHEINNKTVGKGLTLQEMTNELVNDGLLPKGSSSQDLATFLSQPSKFFQEEQDADIANAQETVEKATMPNQAATFQEAREVLNKIKNIDFVNSGLGIKGNISGNSIDKMLSGDAVKKSVSQEAHNFAAANVQKLFENATVNKVEKGKGSNVKLANRLYSPFIYKDEVLLAKITVKEFMDNTSNRIYSIEAIDIEKPVINMASEQLDKNLKGNPSQADKKYINTLVADVKKAQDTLFQSTNKKPRGMFQFSNETEKSIITIFQDRKNLSTTLHEMSHLFLHNLQRAYMLENAPQWVKDSYETLGKELNFDVNKPLSTETHEKFARLGEAYFREGKAPSVELESSFTQFKSWLMSVYRYITQLLRAEDLNDEVRKVFDSLLATEEQIAEAKAKFDSLSLINDDDIQKIYNIPPEQINNYQEAVNKAKQKADAIISLRKTKELRDVERQAKEEARAAIESSTFYIALADFRSKNKIDFNSMLGYVTEKTAFKIREEWDNNGRYKKLFTETKGLSLDDAAEYFNTDGDTLITMLMQELPETKYIEDFVDNAKQEYEATFDTDAEYLSSEMEDALAIEIESLGGKAIPKRQLKGFIEEQTNIKKFEEIDIDYKNLKADIRKQQKITAQVLREHRLYYECLASKFSLRFCALASTSSCELTRPSFASA